MGEGVEKLHCDNAGAVAAVNSGYCRAVDSKRKVGGLTSSYMENSQGNSHLAM
jgi:hypothetical protein